MKKLKKVVQILCSNFDSLILFELIYNIFSLYVFSLLSSLLNFSLKDRNIEYFTQENIIQLFQSPLSILSIVLILLVICFYFYIHYAALTVYFEARNHRLKLFSFLKQVLAKVKRLLIPSNLWILPIIFLFSIMQYLFYSPNIFRIVVPEFIMQVIVENKVTLVLYGGILISLFLLFIVYAPALYSFFIKEKSVKTSLSESKNQMIPHFLKKMGQVILYNLIFWIIFYGIYFVVVLIAILIFKYLLHDSNSFWLVFKRIQALYRLLNPILLIAANLFLINLLAGLDQPEEKKLVEKKKFQLRKLPKFFFILGLFVVFVEFSDPNVYNQIDHTKIKIVDHRGGGIFAPENTIAGIQEAINSGSDYAEIDIQMTKDGVLVLSHDASLKRITGIDEEISNLTYEELATMDVGKNYNPQFQGERIPTLNEVLKFSKGKIKLMIEIKNSSKNQEVVQKTIHQIKENHMENDCTIASLHFEILKQTKQLDKNIETAYIAAFAYGDLLAIKDYVDIYQFEPSYVDDEGFYFLKSEGKKIFVWTLNKEKNISRVLNLPIDGIVTDNPYWTQYVMKTQGKDIVEQLLIDAFP